mmetsp:Transcript_406/g.1016  ORF Transcript_406/g.1016 Transcript_406/m.1016 type:complete len:226 (-) Transcript_406:151-828(-)|eukprot:CAMPEP_0181395898 /NCGR_PEP_ID=MMETSP1106-20121128/28592_1 /TAXON_ID=81844 /ORGANISM="Mantoniella antarctica, Strain SL-175" /LENGTH=225 /DNA_ID=CAMNT_0023517563 /DNA_START=344 /DNA_END=1021 /DNA_ORIENTATION=-
MLPDLAPTGVRRSKSKLEELLPQASYSRNGQMFDMMLSSTAMARSILRTHAHHARRASMEFRDRTWAALAKPKPNRQKEKDPAVGAWEHENALRRTAVRRNLALPFARRAPLPPPRPPTPPRPEPTPHPKSTLPDLERRLARERRRAGEKPQDHPSTHNPDRYSETPVHQRSAGRKVFEIPVEVARERSIITAGRRFTWGGRHKLELPGFNPHRERQLREKVAKF